jgi:hypothetical protein
MHAAQNQKFYVVPEHSFPEAIVQIQQELSALRQEGYFTSEDGAKLYYEYVKGEANSYLAFLGGDFPYIKVVNDENKNGKKLIVFKESYGNPLIPFLAPHFEEIHVADIRYFPYNAVNFINQYGITDVLFVNGLMSASTSARVNEIYSLLNK